ncbi:MAG: protein translocase subunit SecD [bacterium]|jgi:preprotein translocase subunit SecD|nr:MAG: protein translocase subunit SecD [bacterium]
MFGTLKGRFLVIFLILAACGWAFFDNYRECRSQAQAGDEPRLCTPIKLGLDLQGGMHLALEVADPEGTLTHEAKVDATDRALKIIRTRIDEFGVAEPLIQKVGDTRIIVELPGIREEGRAKEIIQRTAFLEWRLVKGGPEFRAALPRIDRAIVTALGPQLEEAEEAASDTAPAPAQRETIEQLLFQRRDTAAAADTASGETVETSPSRRPLTALLFDDGQQHAFLVAEADVPKVKRYLELPEVQRLMPRGVTTLWAAEPESRGAQLYRRLYLVEDRAFLTGERLQDATATRDPQTFETEVLFELDRAGGRQFERITAANIGEQIAIILDNQVHSAPVVQSRIGSRGRITMGGASLEQAQDLALVLRAGALPAPLEILEERTVGPSLGADSIRQGEIAGIIGIALVIAIMVAYYRLAGFLAVLALVFYTILVLGGLAALDATLTAPGIAGLILSIGMAVDANVLIFERIREELAAGRTARAAVDAGFKQAMSAIVDSNLTTLITGLILFQVGTGPVRGFAVTLSIGIIASFVSAVFVTRTLFLLYLQKRRATEPISI